MKFETLYRNLINEQDDIAPVPDATAPQAGESPAPKEFRVPQPENFDDVKPAPSPDADPATNELKQLVTRLVKLSQDLNGFEGEELSIQQYIFSIDKPGGTYNGITNLLAKDIEAAAGNLLDAANKLGRLIISNQKE